MVTIPRTSWLRCLMALLQALALAGAAQAQAPASAPSGTPLCRQLVASGNPQYPPYLWREAEGRDRLVGANTEMLAWLSKELGLPIEARYVGPWGRV